MRVLADENIPLETVRALRNAGHDVFAASEAAPGLAAPLHGLRLRHKRKGAMAVLRRAILSMSCRDTVTAPRTLSRIFRNESDGAARPGQSVLLFLQGGVSA